MGVAMEIISRIQPAPWWAILLLILSSAMLIIGLLILIAPLEKWKGLFSPINIYRRIDNARLWWVRGPKWSWSKPTIKLDGFTPNNPNLGLVRYFTTLSLDIENRDDFPLNAAFYSSSVNVEQGLGRSKVRCSLSPNPSFAVEIKEHHKEPVVLQFFGACNSARCLELKAPYDLGIQGISVSLSGVGIKELHKGIYFKPVPQQHVGKY